MLLQLSAIPADCLDMKWLLALLMSNAFAEYRAFWLEIKPPSGESVRVKSTLDPDQYVGYFPQAAGTHIKYTETWMCRGRTDNLPMCKSPSELSSDSTTANARPGSTQQASGSGQSPERKPSSQ